MAHDLDGLISERDLTHGDFYERSRLSWHLKQVVHQYWRDNGLHVPVDGLEAIDMIMMKISRIMFGDAYVAEHWIDIAGYAKLVADRLEKKDE